MPNKNKKKDKNQKLDKSEKSNNQLNVSKRPHSEVSPDSSPSSVGEMSTESYESTINESNPIQVQSQSIPIAQLLEPTGLGVTTSQPPSLSISPGLISSDLVQSAEVPQVHPCADLGGKVLPPSQTMTVGSLVGHRQQSTRSQFVNSQRGNKYSSNSLPPFVVHMEGIPDTPESNLGNLHPMSLGRSLCSKFNHVKEIKRLGRNIIKIIFTSYIEANKLVDTSPGLFKDSIAYIPNFCIYRVGVVRNVNVELSEQEILDGITWQDEPVRIHKLERLKTRDPLNHESLTDTHSIKVWFEDNLLLEHIYIWRVKCPVTPFINRVRKCLTCSRWGHSAYACRGTPTCSRCDEAHKSETCYSISVRCANCKGNHQSFDVKCPIFEKFKIINIIMAYIIILQY
ncbi:uncharacterized protein LOC118647013 [Monomorium pharaonis]|uniref:uncharacterized protein LOC118647013 n=1 Tax=Monomorium pharaonis TaxID=307658 RepID=UPI001747B46D|nr:uncharacterized protein LOC118647013 [Monomorium pharaonis]